MEKRDPPRREDRDIAKRDVQLPHSREKHLEDAFGGASHGLMDWNEGALGLSTDGPHRRFRGAEPLGVSAYVCRRTKVSGQTMSRIGVDVFGELDKEFGRGGGKTIDGLVWIADTKECSATVGMDLLED